MIKFIGILKNFLIGRIKSMKNIKLSFIGAGNMAGAVITGITQSGGLFSSSDIAIYDVKAETRERYAEGGFHVCDSEADAAAWGDLVFLSVKPQNYKEVLGAIAASGLDVTKKTFVSFAAGISIASIKSVLGDTCPVIRTMPNTPLMIGCGVTAVCPSPEVSSHNLELTCRIFASGGRCIKLPESEMNSIISVTSTSPAYFYKLAAAMCAGAEQQGIDAAALPIIVAEICLGAARMMLESGRTADELVRMVASPNGTTEAALKLLDERNFDEMICEAMKACTKRANELGEELDRSIASGKTN